MLVSLKRVVRVMLWLAVGLSTLVAAVLAVATGSWLTRYNDSVMLPNGFTLKREFEFWFKDRDDMYIADGRTLLARDVEFICFNDRFVQATSRELGQGGLFDAETQGRVPPGTFNEMLEESGLSAKGKTCNGHYRPMLGPSFFYDSLKAPFLPDCSDRNIDDPQLVNRQWFERPCVEDR